jgi:hypothetical protein
MPGDLVEIIKGQYRNMIGAIDGTEESGFVWVTVRYGKSQHEGDTLEPMTIIVDMDDLVVTKPDSILTYSKETGYGVLVGDILQVVRGELRGTVGVVRSFDFLTAEAELFSEANGCRVSRAVIQVKALLTQSRSEFQFHFAECSGNLSSISKLAFWTFAPHRRDSL